MRCVVRLLVFGCGLGLPLWFGLGADELLLRFQLFPGDQPFLGTDNAQRGAALNPVNGNVLVVSRSFGNEIHVLSGDTGEFLHTLNTDGLEGGTFVINMIGVAEDGAVYAGNLSTSSVNPNYKLYRWSDDRPDAIVELMYEGDPGGSDPDESNAQRWGDSMDVRGAGLTTQVLLGSRASNQVAILSTEDGLTFQSQVVDVQGINNGDVGLSVAFSQGDSFYGTAVGRPLRRISFDLAEGTGRVEQSLTGANFPVGLSPLGTETDARLMATLNLSDQTLSLFDITDVENPPIFLASDLSGAGNGNVNGTGAVDLQGERLLVLETNNGLSVWDIERSTEIEPPTILLQPASQTVLETAKTSLSIAVTGTPPFQYQWFFNEEELPEATGADLTLNDVQPSQSGLYKVVVSNEAGTITSEEAVLTVNPVTASNKIRDRWRLEAGTRPYLTTDNTQRGMAVNPASGNVLVASRAGGNRIFVLDGETGDDLHEMNADSDFLITGLFRLNMIAAADDGAVFVGNLTLDGFDFNTPYSLYRWPSDSAEAEVDLAYEGDPGDGFSERWGDTLDARGSGVTTQVIAGARSGERVALFTTTDGVSFERTVLEGTQGGLGLAFGEGNTIWCKGPGGSLFHFAFEPGGGPVTLIREYGVPGEIPSTLVPLSVDPESNLLAGIHISTPDALLIYEVSPETSDLTILTEKPFPTDNPNLNNVGAIDFSNNRLFALDTNNGLLALEIDLTAVTIEPAVLSHPEKTPEGNIRIGVQGTASTAYTLEASSDLVQWSAIATSETDLSGAGVLIDSRGAALNLGNHFYRVVSGQ